MACSKYEYVKKFEDKTVALLQTYIVVRIDVIFYVIQGRGFTKFCQAHNFKKPNDLRAIKLMNAAAEHVCTTFTEIFLAYGQSD
jgi:tRNA(His) guanylyltransferase